MKPAQPSLSDDLNKSPSANPPSEEGEALTVEEREQLARDAADQMAQAPKEPGPTVP